MSSAVNVSDLVLSWCKRAIKYTAATNHFAAIGSTGSGKTLLIRLLLQSIWKVATKHAIPTRMLMYDSKHEMLPIMHGIFEKLGRTDAAEKIILLNPFDERGVAWDISKDIDSAPDADELSSMLVQSNTGDGRFWTEAAQTVIGQVVQWFIQHRSQWDLRDIICATQTKDSIRSVVDRSPHTSWVVDSYLSEPRMESGVMATIHGELSSFRSIAIAWQQATRKISLREWLHGKDGGILVLGSTRRAKTAVDAINRLLFERLAQMVLDEVEELKRDDPRRIWVVLDEFVRAGRLPGAVEFLTEGRSKGVCAVLGFQEIDGLRAEYGREVAHEILGQPANVALLRASSVDTAEWMSNRVGEYRARDRKYGTNEGTSIGRDLSLNQGTGADEMLTDRRSLLPSHFMQIPPVSEGGGIGGAFLSPYWADPGREVNQRLVDAQWMFTEGNLWPLSTVEGIKYRDLSRVPPSDDAADVRWLRPWGDSDYERLSIKQDKQPEQQNGKGGDAQAALQSLIVAVSKQVEQQQQRERVIEPGR